MAASNATSPFPGLSAAEHHVFDLAKLIPLFVPILNLGLVFLQQSTCGLSNALAAVLHVISNPVDSTWSILSRQEAIRHFHLFAASETPDIARELTVVLATFDRWLQDASEHVSRALADRREPQRRISNSSALILEKEKVLIRQAVLSLRGCRIDGTSSAVLSVIVYLIALTALGVRLIHGTEGSGQSVVGHFLPFDSVWSFLVFAICINGSTGTFTHHDEIIRIVFELHKALEALSQQQDTNILLPRPSFDAQLDDPGRFNTNASTFSRQYSDLGITAGSLNCLRLPKTFQTHNTHGRSAAALCFISLCAVVVSYLGAVAICLEMSSLHRLTNFSLLSSCVLSWLTNWILSIGIAQLYSKKIIGRLVCGRILFGCDISMAVLMLSCFVWGSPGGSDADQTADSMTKGKLIIWFSGTVLELAIMLMLYLWAEREGSSAAHIYTRSLDEALADGTAML